MLIGTFLMVERKKRKWTITDMAQKSGLSRGYISMIERNERRPFAAIEAMLTALGLTTADCTAAGVEWWKAEEAPIPYEFPVQHESTVVSGAPGSGKTQYLKTILEYFEKDPDFVIKLANALEALQGGDNHEDPNA